MTRTRRNSKGHWADSYASFRKLLLRGRMDAGLTQREAATLLGRSQGFIAKSESGERRVDVIELAKFAKVYRKAITFFLP